MGTLYTRLIHRSANGCVIALATALASGCLVTSPYYGQKFNSRTSQIPITAWTTKNSTPVEVACTQSGRFGPAPVGGFEIDWTPFESLSVSDSRVYDPKGDGLFTASREVQIPEDCWREIETQSGLRYYTALRVTQTDYLNQPVHVYSNFRKTGLACLGQAVGQTASWLGWSEKDCVNKYVDSDTPIPFILLIADS